MKRLDDCLLHQLVVSLLDGDDGDVVGCCWTEVRWRLDGGSFKKSRAKAVAAGGRNGSSLPV